jgi:hypothetical protein
MALATQLPGSGSVSFVRGDDWGATFDFDIDTTGYSWSASILSVVTDAVIVSPAVAVISAASGQVSVSLSDTQTALLAPGTYRLRLRATAPGDSIRRASEGLVEVKP